MGAENKQEAQPTCSGGTSADQEPEWEQKQETNGPLVLGWGDGGI